MKLPAPFYRLPLKFDAARLAVELAQFTEADWKAHPTGYNGNTAIRLISVDGGENDDFIGRMMPTRHLARCPYMYQILSEFGVIWSRSRLMRLTPGARVPPHSDVNHHWFHRTRVHIPIQTDSTVLFTCGDQTVHMAAGEAWIFDNWRAHTVFNGSARDRIHFVADTVGDAGFWHLVGKSQSSQFEQPSMAPVRAYDPAAKGVLRCESHNAGIVMPPAEMELLIQDLLRDLRPPTDAQQQHARNDLAALSLTLTREWRALWAMFADSENGWTHFRQLKEWAVAELEKLPPTAMCASVDMPAKEILLARVVHSSFNPMLANQNAIPSAPNLAWDEAPAVVPSYKIKQPVFIIAAPRSGSSLLFETLAKAPGVWTVGGESHWLIERIPQLLPWAPKVGSNRLTESHLDVRMRSLIPEALVSRLQDRDKLPFRGGEARVLEKTPKHALRIPFFNALFPDAKFIFLWRDPRENLSSIIDAWNSGGWVTYPELKGWDGKPWSLLLPPEWEALNGRPLEEIAAFQWSRTNQIALDDLEQLPEERWTTVNYAEFLNDPAKTIERLCAFADVEFDTVIEEYVSRPLPLSAHTLTAPAADKWRHNQALIERVLPGLEALSARLLALNPPS
jgi:hypothetical protein